MNMNILECYVQGYQNLGKLSILHDPKEQLENIVLMSDQSDCLIQYVLVYIFLILDVGSGIVLSLNCSTTTIKWRLADEEIDRQYIHIYYQCTTSNETKVWFLTNVILLALIYVCFA